MSLLDAAEKPMTRPPCSKANTFLLLYTRIEKSQYGVVIFLRRKQKNVKKTAATKVVAFVAAVCIKKFFRHKNAKKVIENPY